jgi:hypothetical protein
MTNIVIAQVKGQAETSLVKFTTDEPLFSDLSWGELSTTFVRNKFRRNKWRRIENVASEPYFPDFLKPGKSGRECQEITSEQFSEIQWLCELHKHFVYIQRVTPSVYEPITFLDFNGQISFKKRFKPLKIHNLPEAVYSYEDDTLHYRTFGSLECVFKGIHRTVNESEDEFTGSFLSSRLLFNLNNLKEKDFSLENQKRMTHLNHVTYSLSLRQRRILVDYLGEVNPRLIPTPSYTEIVVRDDDDLSQLVETLDEAIFTPDAVHIRSLELWKRPEPFQH